MIVAKEFFCVFAFSLCSTNEFAEWKQTAVMIRKLGEMYQNDVWLREKKFTKL
jgi:hypothetical protein